MTGLLLVVSTPIGNLGDLSRRAAEALEESSVVCCEDTRHTGGLLKKLGLRAKRLMSLHEHNELSRIPEILDRLALGEQIALVSDAGTPLISDPGRRIVRAAIDAGFEVQAIPGASAVLCALSISGFGVERFCFEGFLPRKGMARAETLKEIATESRPTVLYEAPSRVAATLSDLAATCGSDREVAVCRELTKLHEEVWRGKVSESIAALGNPRGEYVLVVGPALKVEVAECEVLAAIKLGLAQGSTKRDVARDVAAATGWSRRVVYELVIGSTGSE